MKFKLPQLHLLVDSNKKLSDDNPKKLIHVVNGYAIVNNELIVIVSLREYVKIECGITDELELDRLTGILEWMEGKSFTKEFWSELVKECYVNITGDDKVEIEHQTYNKILVYEDIITEKELSLQVVSDNICRPEMSLYRIAFGGLNLSNLTKAFKNELKNDTIILEFTGQENAIKFTLSRRDYIFGLIPADFNSAQELTAFLGNGPFKEELDEQIPLLSITEKIDVNQLEPGRILSQRVLKSWKESFIDEDSGEKISVDRNEIIFDKKHTLSKDDVLTIVNAGVNSVTVYKK